MGKKSVARELVALEQQYWQAIKERDAETAMHLSDDPCIVAGAQGMSRIARKDLGAMINWR